MSKNLKEFGKILKELRIQKGLTLRRASRLADYDPSNWSKIERGKISPPSDERILKRWARILGFSNKSSKIEDFIDAAMIAQGIIPQDILSQANAVKYLPAFFRTVRNKKPTKEEIDQLIELIRGS
jgi:transcriptional regulator with XRE-family HTH domain